jgi:ABC-2 type transport system permease protein
MLSARFRTALQYRSAAFAGLCTQLFWGLIRCMIFAAFYRSTTQPQSMSLTDTFAYVWLGQAMFSILPWQIDTDVQSMVRTGTVAYEMLRPVDLYGFWFVRALATRVAPLLMKAAPLLIAAGLWLGLRPPSTWQCAVGWIVATVIAALLASAMSTLMTISLLWSTAGDGVARLAPTVMYVLCGMAVPLAFFPDWCRPILDALPFRDLVDVPFRIYLGLFPSTQWPSLFAGGIAWTLAFIVVGRILLARGTRHLVVQGG